MKTKFLLLKSSFCPQTLKPGYVPGGQCGLVLAVELKRSFYSFMARPAKQQVWFDPGFHKTLPFLCRYAGLANLTGVPAVTVPVGYNALGLPCGLQVRHQIV